MAAPSPSHPPTVVSMEVTRQRGERQPEERRRTVDTTVDGHDAEQLALHQRHCAKITVIYRHTYGGREPFVLCPPCIGAHLTTRPDEAEVKDVFGGMLKKRPPRAA